MPPGGRFFCFAAGLFELHALIQQCQVSLGKGFFISILENDDNILGAVRQFQIRLAPATTAGKMTAVQGQAADELHLGEILNDGQGISVKTVVVPWSRGISIYVLARLRSWG